MEAIFSSDLLPEEQLKNLKLYKYSAVDKSFTSRFILKYYWDKSIEAFPLWIAQVFSLNIVGRNFDKRRQNGWEEKKKFKERQGAHTKKERVFDRKYKK